ncbi:MAG: indolepyruvate oxidoreductase subunit beta [Muribaculaceae bacterium]|nr:indolepyruvate oxidoreductase subunit beta [Muribaculaceae bacterium]
MKTDIILAGVGGQGILSIATVLGRAALMKDLYIKQAEVHGMSQRGGDVQSNLRISDKPIASDLIPYNQADLLVSLEPMECLRYIPFLNKRGWVITSTVPFINIPNYPDIKTVMNELEKFDNLVAFDMDKMAKDIGSPRSTNIILLGAASPFISIPAEDIVKGIEDVFERKGQKIVDMNVKAFECGRQATLDFIKDK